MKLNNEFDKYLFANRYLILFIATILQVFLVTFFPDDQISIVNGLTFSLFILANINLIRDSKQIIYVMIFFALAGIILEWIPEKSDLGQIIFPYEKVVAIVFIGVVISQIVRQIIKSKSVDANVILGVITIYIMFGLVAGECNLLIYFFDNDAFIGNIDPSDTSDFKYFSYVTMTTLGYGDISPLSQMARATAVFFSLIGQIYLAVVIAFIVGKYVSHSDKKETKGSKE
jgi:voltage-gated potassium channel